MANKIIQMVIYKGVRATLRCEAKPRCRVNEQHARTKMQESS
jgi:hypothetical protein